MPDIRPTLIPCHQGLPATITLKNGERYSGVLSGTSLEPNEMRYVFKMVKKLLPTGNAQTNGSGDVSDDYVGTGDYYVMSFDMSDVADFNVNNVMLDKTQTRTQNGASGFRTDTDISGHMAMRERNLQKWEPAEVDSTLTLDSAGRSTDWDQFATNERMFGVKSNYDETFYTTTIDRSDPQYAEKAARAERIAREIEASTAFNSHVREERGGVAATEDVGGDEEDKYSGVRREFPALSSGQPNKYTPPARRAPTGQSTVHGAPVDPAIISASLARPDSAASKSAQRTPSPAVDKVVAPEPVKAAPPKAEVPASNPPQPEPSKEATPKTEAKPAAASKPVAEQSTRPSASIKTTVAAIPPRRSDRPRDATTNVEHDLLDSFKQFSAAEKLRMTERQRTIARENKAVKLNDLKKFALNFKLSTPVPSDLVPILAKDETKQQAIVEKALRQVQETKSSPPKATRATSDTKITARATASKPDSAQASPSVPADRQQNQRTRPGQPPYAAGGIRDRPHQNTNQAHIRNNGPLSTRLQMNQQQHKQQGAQPYNSIPQPIPTHEMRNAPTGPSQPSSGMQTPTSAISSRFNVRAHEFKPNPAANTFQPGGNTSANSSPRPDPTARQESRRPTTITSFFGGQRPTLKSEAVDSSNDSPNALQYLSKDVSEYDKTHNNGLPHAYRTPPTWDFPTTNAEKGYVNIYEHAPPAPSSAHHNAMNNGQMPHQHQLPPHLQGPQGLPQGQVPHHASRGPPVQAHHNQAPHHFEAPHMQFSHSSSSMHPSPRPMPPYPYGAQPQAMPGFPQQVQMPQYSMSPNVQHVALHGRPGGQFVGHPGPAMGGQMMTTQASNGPFMGMPANPQMQMYSPAPGHVYPQYPGHMPGGPGTNGFPSPRPAAPMMSHQGSQQGHQQPPMMYMQAGVQGPQMFQMPPGSSKFSIPTLPSTQLIKVKWLQ